MHTLQCYYPEAIVVCHNSVCQCSHKHVHQGQETCPWGLVEATDHHCMVVYLPQPSIIEIPYALSPHPFDVLAVDQLLRNYTNAATDQLGSVLDCGWGSRGEAIMPTLPSQCKRREDWTQGDYRRLPPIIYY